MKSNHGYKRKITFPTTMMRIAATSFLVLSAGASAFAGTCVTWSMSCDNGTDSHSHGAETVNAIGGCRMAQKLAENAADVNCGNLPSPHCQGIYPRTYFFSDCFACDGFCVPCGGAGNAKRFCYEVTWQGATLGLLIKESSGFRDERGAVVTPEQDADEVVTRLKENGKLFGIKGATFKLIACPKFVAPEGEPCQRCEGMLQPSQCPSCEMDSNSCQTAPCQSQCNPCQTVVPCQPYNSRCNRRRRCR